MTSSYISSDCCSPRRSTSACRSLSDRCSASVGDALLDLSPVFPSRFLPASDNTLSVSASGGIPPDNISPVKSETLPSLITLNDRLSNDAAIFWILPSSIVELAKSNMKKQSNRFIRSLNVDIHAGDPSSGGCCFLFAISDHRPLLQIPDDPLVPGMTSVFLL